MPTKKASKKKTAAKKATGNGRLLTDEEIINPEIECTISTGETLVVRPWGMTKGALILERMNALTPKLAGAQTAGDDGQAPPIAWNASTILSNAFDEVVDLVSLTVDVPRESMEREPHEGGWTFEDLLEVTAAMIEVCVVRSDGKGALPLLIRVVGKMTTALLRQGAKPLSQGSVTQGTSTAQ